jgi:hypothetical protein
MAANQSDWPKDPEEISEDLGDGIMADHLVLVYRDWLLT